MSGLPGLMGLRHVALVVTDMARMRWFYESVIGLLPVWVPDEKNVYLSMGRDNLALHTGTVPADAPQRLDHLGFCLAAAHDVDAAAERLVHFGLVLDKPVRTHRDGSRSCYVRDPDGNLVQLLFIPDIARAG